MREERERGLGLTYFKRYRMEIDLAGRVFDTSPPLGYRLVAWDESMLETHAETKYLSFRTEIDANVFPCLGELAGCHRLMHEIRRKDGFLPGATWLAVYQPTARSKMEYCGTIQGIRDQAQLGAIQNLGVTPEHRSQGLGGCLLRKALVGFQQSGLTRAFLEVTAQNAGAIGLYQQIGFARSRTVYKAVEVAFT